MPLPPSFPSPAAPPNADGARVLIVDDNRELARNLGEILDAEGYVPEVVFDSTAALGCTLETYAAIVLDLRMPGLSGVELLRALRAQGVGAPAIAITAYSSDDAIRDARAAGAGAVLLKPVPIDALLATLARLIAAPC